MSWMEQEYPVRKDLSANAVRQVDEAVVLNKALAELAKDGESDIPSPYRIQE